MRCLKMHVLPAYPQNKRMSIHILNLFQTKLYVFSFFYSAVYFSGASKNKGATIFYAYFRW